METIKVKMKPEMLGGFERYLYERENARATIGKYITDIRTFYAFSMTTWRLTSRGYWNTKNGF